MPPRLPARLAPVAFAAALAAAAFAAASSLAVSARAYCRSSTCEPNAELGIQGAQCEPHELNDCGVPLRWERDCIGITFQEDASDEISLKAARSAMKQAFQTWESADCGKGGPGIHVVDMGTVECDRVEYEPKAGNANILIFRDGEWLENGYDKLALTTVNYDKESGEIWNADIEVNTADYDFDQGEASNSLLAVLTHEAGHFLGLAHNTSDGEATMFATYHATMVDLTEDDAIGICQTYPPRFIDTATCNPIPRHGFSTRCASRQTEGQCGIVPVDKQTVPGQTPILPVAAALGLFMLRRRARRRGARTSRRAPSGRP